MSKKIITAIFGAFIVSIGTVVILFAMSGIMKDKRNSFLRIFPPHPAIEGDTFNIKSHSYYIAGVSKTQIYLGNYRSPLRMIVLNMALRDTQRVRLNIEGIHDQKFWAARVQVDSPNFYLTDGAVPIIYKGDVQNWSATKYKSDSIFFRSFLPVKNTFFVKSLSGSTGENILGKLSPWPPFQSFKNDILQKQLDGVFCTDGLMRYNRDQNQVVYLYYYRNQFIVMDTMLNLLHRGNTIDTISHAKVKVATIESENSKTLSSPPYFVNKWFDTSGNWLFVNSNLLAKNEHPRAFDSGEVIDMYDLSSGKYKFSFHVYNLNRPEGSKRMNEFCVFGDKMFVRYENIVRIYHLKPEYFVSDIFKSSYARNPG